MTNIYSLMSWLICLFFIRETACIEPITIAAGIGVFGSFYAYNSVKCYFYECCNDEYIPQNIRALSSNLHEELFGQEHAIELIVSALSAHYGNKKAPKALAMAFHGPPGTGKNYVATMIRDAFFKKGISSEYYHFFNGKAEFPLDRDVSSYQIRLRNTIAGALIKCPKSLFVFDEVDDMAEGVLDALVQFLDYGSTQVWYGGSKRVIETRSATFIFLSNTGSQQIIDTLIAMWQDGISREEINVSDFDHLIAMGAFNEKGGFHKSGTISTSLIDHYVPFFPLETHHVNRCIKKSFQKYGLRNPTTEHINEVMSYITFGPEPENIYATSGCKRLDNKVASIAYRRRI